MKYVFGFNVGVKLYKKFPTIQVFIQDRLIDEIQLDDSHAYTEFSLLDDDERLTNKPFKSLFNNVSKKIHLYILNDECLQDNIKLVVKNQDSNYTNGFMTKSTIIRFSHIFLMPEEIFLDVDAQSQIAKPFINDFSDASIDTTTVRDKKFITSWPVYDKHMGKHMGRDYGGDITITLPVVQDMKYKHFDTDPKIDEYFPASDVGFDDRQHNNVYVNVSRFIQMCKKISNKYKYEDQ
jgi:hypothetical protein